MGRRSGSIGRDRVRDVVSRQRRETVKVSPNRIFDLEDLRKRVGLPSTEDSRNIAKYIRSYQQNNDEFTAASKAAMLFEEDYDDYISFVENVNKDVSDTAEDKVGELEKLTKVLSVIRQEGFDDILLDDGLITKEEADAVASYDLLSDTANDLLTLVENCIMLTKTTDDFGAVLQNIREEYNTSSHRFNMDGNPVIEYLQEIGVAPSTEGGRTLDIDRSKLDRASRRGGSNNSGRKKRSPRTLDLIDSRRSLGVGSRRSSSGNRRGNSRRSGGRSGRDARDNNGGERRGSVLESLGGRNQRVDDRQVDDRRSDTQQRRPQFGGRSVGTSDDRRPRSRNNTLDLGRSGSRQTGRNTGRDRSSTNTLTLRDGGGRNNNSRRRNSSSRRGGSGRNRRDDYQDDYNDRRDRGGLQGVKVFDINMNDSFSG